MSMMVVLPTQQAVEWDCCDEQSTKTASELFEEMVNQKGCMAVAEENGERTLVTEFPETAEKVMIVYRQVGG